MQLDSLSLLDNVVQLRLIGRLDLEGTQSISDKFAFATTVRKGKYVVDLSAVTFLTSIGIRMLITSAKAQVNRGGKLILAAPQPQIRQVIEASGIDKLIEMAANVETAIASLKALPST